uniref:Protein kinase domain-containing protein n=1 Tax=Hordeum vulgare subsp. vulgare TaxID=112509 RepID=A0A8I7B218_HORVV
MSNTTIIKLPNKEEISTGHVDDSDSLRLVENRRFTYKELEVITHGFERVLGQGGFGHVYDGFMEDGTHVAVKLRSHSSNQGVKEFLTEAQILTRIHHKNLVAMIGYCKDGEYMALVYEYMSQGTLLEHIVGGGRSFPWRQRLRVALESAQGLEYLHKGCNPPLIHRDVKATNILLNARLEAKIADFGMSKAFDHHNGKYIAANTFVGTLGYVDPEYQATMRPTTKSDVYSFGVVLLELVTGKSAILSEPEPTNIIHWVRQRLTRGNIEGVVDAQMHGGYNANGVWKVAEIALKCTAQASAQRPTMADVVAQLQECVELEESLTQDFNTGGSNIDSSWNYNGYGSGQSTDVSSNATFETELRIPTVPLGPGPVAR